MDRSDAIELLIQIAREKAERLKMSQRMLESWESSVKIPAGVRRDARRYRDILEAIGLVKGLQNGNSTKTNQT